MNCDEARRLMHEVLDGEELPREQLGGHLSGCAACRAEFEALQAIQAAVERAVSCAAPSQALERATHGALQALRYERAPAHGGRRWLAVAVAAGVLGAFGLGLLGGRAVWPREVLKVERVPQVVEKVVEVGVPVVKERIVERRVTVERTRIVYREPEVHWSREMIERAPVAERPEAATEDEAESEDRLDLGWEELAMRERPAEAEEAPAALRRFWIFRPRPYRAEPVVPDRYVTRLDSSPVLFANSASNYVRPAVEAEDAEPDGAGLQETREAGDTGAAGRLAGLPTSGPETSNMHASLLIEAE